MTYNQISKYLVSNELFVEKYVWFCESLKELAISFLLNNYPILPWACHSGCHPEIDIDGISYDQSSYSRHMSSSSSFLIRPFLSFAQGKTCKIWNGKYFAERIIYSGCTY